MRKLILGSCIVIAGCGGAGQEADSSVDEAHLSSIEQRAVPPSRCDPYAPREYEYRFYTDSTKTVDVGLQVCRCGGQKTLSGRVTPFWEQIDRAFCYSR